MSNIMATVKSGVSRIQRVYERQKRVASIRAKRRMESAKTKLEKETIKAGLEQEQLKIERKMYEAKAAVVREREAMRRARKAAGVTTWGEQARDFMGGLRKTVGGTSRKPRSKRRVSRRQVSKRS